MTVFSIEVQRRVRLRNAQKFDLSDVLGEPLFVHIGEMPQSQQAKVVAFLEVRRELLEAARKGSGGTVESAAALIKKLGEEIQADEALDAATHLGEVLTKKLLSVMQELIAAAMLDGNGDRMSSEDARTLFELLPANKEVAQLMHLMSEAVLSRLGGKKPDPNAPAPKAAEALGK